MMDGREMDGDVDGMGLWYITPPAAKGLASFGVPGSFAPADARLN
jgi:hypothetical protein